jgi:hypothetical protein
MPDPTGSGGERRHGAPKRFRDGQIVGRSVPGRGVESGVVELNGQFFGLAGDTDISSVIPVTNSEG